MGVDELVSLLQGNWTWLWSNATQLLPIITATFAAGFYTAKKLSDAKIDALEQRLELEREHGLYSEKIGRSAIEFPSILSKQIDKIIKNTKINLEQLAPSIESGTIIVGNEFIVTGIVEFEVPPPVTAVDVELCCCDHPVGKNIWHSIVAKRVPSRSGRIKLTGIIPSGFTCKSMGGKIGLVAKVGIFDQESGALQQLKGTTVSYYPTSSKHSAASRIGRRMSAWLR